MQMEPALQYVKHGLGTDVHRRDVADELALMHLLAPCQKRGHGRNTEAAANIAHQIVDAGGVAHLLLRNAGHAGRHQRNEQKRHSRALYDLRPEYVPIAGVEVQAGQAEHGESAGKDPDKKKFARIHAVGELAADGSHQERAYAAWRQGEPRLKRWIVEQRLKINR